MHDRPDIDAASEPSDWGPLVSQHYAQLRRLAHAVARSEVDSATALLHSVLLRLPSVGADERKDPARLLALVSWRLRRKLIDRARRMRAEKRGGGRARVHFDPAREEHGQAERSFDFLDLHEALSELRRTDRRKWQVVELRFFAGLSMPATAGALGVSLSTAEKEWSFCKAWLQRRLAER